MVPLDGMPAAGDPKLIAPAAPTVTPGTFVVASETIMVASVEITAGAGELTVALEACIIAPR